MKGVGIHTGKESKITIEEGIDRRGIYFYKDGVEIPATVANVTGTLRCTTIGKDGVNISTVEHLLSVCTGYKLDNLNVYVEGDEIPILDGSARVLAENMLSMGTTMVGQKFAKIIKIKNTIHVSDGESMIVGMPSDSFSVGCMVDYNHPIAGLQAAYYNDDHKDYFDNISPARTFGFWEEVKHLLEKNLAKGGTLENALVIKQDGYLNEPRFPDEIVRHKLLDVLGDLALAGGRILGHIFAVKPSHRLNVEFVKKLVQGENQEEERC